jgi:hypothetical protein
MRPRDRVLGGIPGNSFVCAFLFSAFSALMVRAQDMAVANGPACEIDATVYEVRMPVDKISRIDFEGLTLAAKDPAAFQKKLAEVGPARPLYHAAQSVKLAGDKISLLKEEPFIDATVRATRGGARGVAPAPAPATRGAATAPAATARAGIASATPPAQGVIYRSTGAVFTIAGQAVSADRVNLDLKVDVTTISESTIPVSETVKSGIVRNAQMAHKGLVDAGKPFVIVHADASSVDALGDAVAYVVWVSLGAPKSN